MSKAEIKNICAILCGLESDREVAEQLMLHVLKLAEDLSCQSAVVIMGDHLAAAKGMVDLATQLGVHQIWCLDTQTEAATMQRHARIDVLAANLPACSIVQDDCLFLMNASPDEEEIAAAVALRLNAVALGRCEQILVNDSKELSVLKSAFGGRMKVTRALSAGHFFAIVRGADLQQSSLAQTVSKVTVLDVSATAKRPALPITITPRSELHPSIDGARILVSGGRGIGSEAGFDSLYALAEKLGGAVSASLPAVDAGWAPVARQVGQSGKYVRPDIYIAVAMSGTPQHMAGIDPHTQIIAINSDPEAPIFKQAQIGVVADWSQIIPALDMKLNSQGV
ncbi:electron transfer flavoprotein subunit alpha/FixB family protein [Zwartia vadi]|uniref:electron transfer flavoprotein subunit alpha/FixB family protein n=1 Tax=Zwartia vadi TaxID=3058168 RepID=UPI0025B3400B|nr:electron transfer flavoprotein subunit alpha/FixB family protein [Zwartia vadi]MDN3987971.1 electron transfer flavoprotein subunit alpha/FixB family protein [Zwartia vadi]